jgi:hypothetical protein
VSIFSIASRTAAFDLDAGLIAFPKSARKNENGCVTGLLAAGETRLLRVIPELVPVGAPTPFVIWNWGGRMNREAMAFRDADVVVGDAVPLNPNLFGGPCKDGDTAA